MLVDVSGFELETFGKVACFSPCSGNVVCSANVEAGAVYVLIGF